ncbi:unnamed protein product [Ixodes hexagonus]
MSIPEEPSDCLACLKELTPDCKQLKCTECNNSYHVGKCAGVNKTRLKAMTPSDLSSWVCTTCTVHSQRQSSETDSQSRASASQTEKRTKEDIMSQLSKTNQTLLEVLSRVENIEKKLNLQSAKHDTVIQKLDKQEKTIETIENTTEMLSKQYDDLIKKVDSLARVTNELKKRTREIENLGMERDTRIKDLEWAVEKAEQYSRRKNIEIHGIAQSDREELTTVLSNLATKLDLPDPQSDKIESMHRLKAREGKIPPIIVRFRDRSERDSWVSKRTALKANRNFINENLTRLQRWLFWNAKECARQKGYKYVWMSNGRVLVRQRDGSAVIRIDDESDLDKIH